METAFAATFLAILQDGTIAGAARQLRLTPGAVALRIKTLERELGITLIERVGRVIEPTPAGLRLAPALSAIVASTSDLQLIAKGEGVITGELRIGTIATASTGILPKLAHALLLGHPGIDLLVEPGTSIELCARVREGSLDAAIVVEPPGGITKGEAFDRWVEEPLVVIAPIALAGSDPVALLESKPLIRYDRRGWGGRRVDDWLREKAIIVQSRIELDSLDGIEAMVAIGLGIAIIPEWHGRMLSSAKITTIKLPPPIPFRAVGLFSRRLSRRQDLIDLLCSSFWSPCIKMDAD